MIVNRPYADWAPFSWSRASASPTIRTHLEGRLGPHVAVEHVEWHAAACRLHEEEARRRVVEFVLCRCGLTPGRATIHQARGATCTSRAEPLDEAEQVNGAVKREDDTPTNAP